MMTTEAIEFRYLCDLVGTGATVFWPSNGIVRIALFAISPFDWERKAKAQSLPQPSFTILWTPFFLPYHIMPNITLPCSTKPYHITPHYTSPRHNISPHTILHLHFPQALHFRVNSILYLTRPYHTNTNTNTNINTIPYWYQYYNILHQITRYRTKLF